MNIIFNPQLFYLVQTELQKKQTYIAIAVLAFVACIFILDAFAKGSLAAGKSHKKVVLFFSFMIILVFVAVYVAINFAK